MAIMFLFLILSVVFVIGTSIYINTKKQNANPYKKQTNTSEVKEQKKKRIKKNLADIFDFKIKNNIISIGNRYSMVIRLGNIDYNMLSEQEQDSIESILIQTALAIDYPIQFFSTTEFIDTSKVVNMMKQNNIPNFKVQEYKKYLMEYLDNLMENRTISIIKNYAIISYDGFYLNAIEELNRRATSFKGNLLRAKIVCEILNEDELYDLMYREINKNSAMSISQFKEGRKNLYVGKTQKRK